MRGLCHPPPMQLVGRGQSPCNQLTNSQGRTTVDKSETIKITATANGVWITCTATGAMRFIPTPALTRLGRSSR
jgi:hypothetical protein